ncbi:hypothetical protein BST61_g1452 [Cercospora zeina]
MITDLRTEYNTFMPAQLGDEDQVPGIPEKYGFLSARQQFDFWQPHFQKVVYQALHELHGIVCLTTLLEDEAKWRSYKTMFCRYLVHGYHTYTWKLLGSDVGLKSRASAVKQRWINGFREQNESLRANPRYTVETFGIPFFRSVANGMKQAGNVADYNTGRMDDDNGMDDFWAQ